MHISAQFSLIISLTDEVSGRTLIVPTPCKLPALQSLQQTVFHLSAFSPGVGVEGAGGWADVVWHRNGWCPRNTLAHIGHWRTALFGYLNPSEKEAGLPWWLSGKEPTCQCRMLGFDPWVGKICWRRKRQRTPVFLPGKSHGQRSLAGYSPWGWQKSQTQSSH